MSGSLWFDVISSCLLGLPRRTEVAASTLVIMMSITDFDDRLGIDPRRCITAPRHDKGTQHHKADNSHARLHHHFLS
ncbi:hypothetical protein ACU8V3_13960 [Cobetia marina]